MNISDEEVKAAIEAWFGDFTPPSNYNKDMRRALKAALRVRKKRKRERKRTIWLAAMEKDAAS